MKSSRTYKKRKEEITYDSILATHKDNDAWIRQKDIKTNNKITSNNMLNTCGTPTKYLTSVLYTPVAEPSCANCLLLINERDKHY
jgi:hypothetical protein